MPVEQTSVLLVAPEFRTSLSGSPFNKVTRVESLTANRTVTEFDGGTLFLCNKAASLAITLPSLENIDVGTNFTFYYQTSVAGGSSTITAQSGDLLLACSIVTNWDTDSSNVAAFYSPNGSSHLVTTFNGSTQGGLLGTWVTYTAITSVGWLVKGETYATSTVATPFS